METAHKNMTAEEICYDFKSTIEDHARDYLWGEMDQLRGEVNAIMDAIKLRAVWDQHIHGLGGNLTSVKEFADVHLGPTEREAVVSRYEEIEKLYSEWRSIYYGLKAIAKKENERRRKRNEQT